MFEGYGVYGTHELWNNNRTYHYATVAGLKDPGFMITGSPCNRLPLICDIPDGGLYSDPLTDDAPWYDAAFPESAEVAGLWVTDITDFSNLGSREVTATPFGATTSRRNLDPKTLTVTGWIVGKTCCATQYYYRWLCKRLMERDCVTNLETSMLSMYDCCPDADESVGFTDEQLIDKYLRAMYNVKVAKDPIVIQKLGVCCGSGCGSTSIQVQWTYVLENPKLYRQTQLEVVDEVWPTDIQCMQFGCDPCPAEETVEVELTYQKTRYPVSVSVNGTWCPVGDWVASDYFDNPTWGYLDIVNIETESTALQISVSYAGTWTAIGWDPTDVDLCSVNIEIVEAVQGSGVVAPGATITAVGDNKRVLPLELTITSTTGGTWAAQGWTHTTSSSAAFPPLYSELKVFTDCGCSGGSSGCEIVLNDDLTWDPFEFDYVGILPPYGCDNLSVRRSNPGTYTVLADVPVSQAFNGCNISSVSPPEPFAGLSSCYCQPLEWVEYAAQISFPSGIERAEPYLEFYSGSSALYNFKADFYALPSSVADWVTDGVLTEDLSCVEPSFSIRVGKSIPAGSTYIYEPQTASIRLAYNDVLYDYSASTSSANGGSPYFFQFPECYGVVVVVTAEVHNGTLPANDATISLGYAPFVYVGV